MKRFITLGIIIVSFILFLTMLEAKKESETQKLLNKKKEFVQIGESQDQVEVEIVRSPEEWQRGLMFVEKLGSDSGMLFWGEEDIQHGFWMKDTLIPLDMIFISSEMIIVDINHSAQPCSEFLTCDTYTPPFTYRHVLEVNGGYSERNDINVGDRVEIVLSSDL